jgi:hypothetical protein
MRSAAFLGMFLIAASGFAKEPYGSIADLKLAKPEDGKDVPKAAPPSGAVVLFDGKSLDGWTKRDGKSPAHWKLMDNGAVQVAGGGDIISKQKFGGTFKLHVEFRVPYEPQGKGQGRGNSGVYVQGRYEIQVLDSYGLKSGANDCGAIYGVATPLVNACKAPTVWQSYDIEFQSPVCEGGKKKAPALMTVHHNGVKIHENVKITSDNTTSGAGGDVCQPGPVLLQDHGNPVQYRNIWVVQGKE